MKKLIYLAVMLTSLSAYAAAPPEVNEKVLKAFKETFSEARNVTWTEMEDSYKADFKMSQAQVRAFYDNDGNLLETVRYYDEKMLPLNIITSVKKKYPGRQIFGVTEISAEGDIVYHITLRDGENWYVVKADPYANLMQTKKFKDASK